jgi:AraC-like DNA-binding protein
LDTHSHRHLSVMGRFLLNVNKTDACWLWTGTINKFGYGRFSIKAVHYTAHRISYELFVGQIPEGLFLLHSCDNPSCVNPSHLSPGTHTDNMKDMFNKHRQVDHSGSRNPSAKLTEENVDYIRSCPNTQTSCKELAKQFGVVENTIKRVFTGDRWSGRTGANVRKPTNPNFTRFINTPGVSVLSDVGEKYHRFTLADAQNIRTLRTSGLLLREIATQYGMSEAHVSQICLQKAWPDDSGAVVTHKGSA